MRRTPYFQMSDLLRLVLWLVGDVSDLSDVSAEVLIHLWLGNLR